MWTVLISAVLTPLAKGTHRRQDASKQSANGNRGADKPNARNLMPPEFGLA
jgi:hypothetical protein